MLPKAASLGESGVRKTTVLDALGEILGCNTVCEVLASYLISAQC